MEKNDLLELQPTEHIEQFHLFQWARLSANRYPELKLMFAIPNAQIAFAMISGKNKQEKKIKEFTIVNYLKAEGMQKGVPDIFLPAARKHWNGLFIELKTKFGGKVSPEQEQWISDLTLAGYKAVVCRGLADAIEIITNYLS